LRRPTKFTEYSAKMKVEPSERRDRRATPDSQLGLG
jgi:hypothetical protein